MKNTELKVGQSFDLIEWIHSPTGDVCYIGHQGIEIEEGIIYGNTYNNGSYMFVIPYTQTVKRIAKLTITKLK